MQNENITIVGTAHVSEKSIREVEEAIERVKPDVVAVELDERRYRSIMEGGDDNKEIQVKELLKGNNLAVFLIQLSLSYVQRKVGVGAGVKPGSEMVAAAESAKKHGAGVELIDRDISVTLSRFWGKMTFFDKLKMLYSLVLATLGFGGEDIDMDSITQEDVVSDMVGELRKFAPSAATVLIDERDAFMAHRLLEIGRTKKVVGVVGAGHRNGIMKYMEHPETLPPLESISELPKKRRIGLFKIIGVLSVLIMALVFLLLLFSGIPLYELAIAIVILFLVKGILSALFVAIIGGHRKSIAICFVLAWCSLVNPVIHIGWLAGGMEAAERPPTMKDLRTILGNEEDGFIDTLKNMYRNKLFKVLMVAALANVGSFCGTLVGVALIAWYLNITDPVGMLQTGSANGYHTIVSWIQTVI